MKLIALASFLFCSIAGAADLKITAFYKLDQDNLRDRAADVCFSLSPAPEAPLFATVTVDKGYNTQGTYSAWIGTSGKTCLIVATFANRVEVEVPSLSLSQAIDKNSNR